MSLHLIPLCDEREHNFDDDCWCDPTIEYISEDTDAPYYCGPIIVHNPADNRRQLEKRGIIDPNKKWQWYEVDPSSM